jgi:hypothetical protein
MQPAGKRVRRLDCAGPSREDKKGRLKRILGVMAIPEHTTTHAQHHGTMAIDKRRESSRIAIGDEPGQQRRIRHRVRGDHSADTADQTVGADGHRDAPHGGQREKA